MPFVSGASRAPFHALDPLCLRIMLEISHACVEDQLLAGDTGWGDTQRSELAAANERLEQLVRTNQELTSIVEELQEIRKSQEEVWCRCSC